MAPERKSTCLTCKHIRVLKDAGRCAECNEKYNRKRERERARTRQQPHYDTDWRKLSRDTIEKHVRQYGYVCTICKRANPKTNPLTLDHVKERSLDNGVQVMCRSCNSAKGARHGNAQRRQKPEA